MVNMKKLEIEDLNFFFTINYFAANAKTNEVKHLDMQLTVEKLVEHIFADKQTYKGNFI